VLALYQVLKAGDSVNVSSQNHVTVNALISAVVDIMQYKGEVLRCPSRSSYVFCHDASNQKMLALIQANLQPFPVGLEKTVRWYLKYFQENPKALASML
jgi:UDP-glucose 4-epimerase